MKYLKKFESFDELKDQLAKLSDTMKSFKTLAKLNYRRNTPLEIIEDYFLEFKEIEKFHIYYHDVKEGYGPIVIYLENILDEENIESEFYRYVNKLQSIKKRIEEKLFDCHFSIKLNGKHQSDLNPKTNKNDDYKFKGLGDKRSGHDSKGIYHTDTPPGWITNRPWFIMEPNKVAIKIEFYII
jgi:hypothetical protein